MRLEGIQKLLFGLYLPLFRKDSLRLVQHRPGLAVCSIDVLSHLGAAVVEVLNSSTDALELLSHLAKILYNLAIALYEFLLDIQS